VTETRTTTNDLVENYTKQYRCNYQTLEISPQLLSRKRSNFSQKNFCSLSLSLTCDRYECSVADRWRIRDVIVIVFVVVVLVFVVVVILFIYWQRIIIVVVGVVFVLVIVVLLCIRTLF
jgi:Flp pilus assembly protein TadB